MESHYLLTTPVKKQRQQLEPSRATNQIKMASPSATVSSQNLQKMLETMQQVAITMQALADRPLAPVVMLPAPVHPGGVMGRAHLPLFDGSTDPDQHIEMYKNVAHMEKWDDQQRCSCFYRTMRKSAETWHIRNSEVLEQGA